MPVVKDEAAARIGDDMDEAGQGSDERDVEQLHVDRAGEGEDRTPEEEGYGYGV